MGAAAEVVGPDPVEDLRLAEHAARVAHQEAEQLELGRGQLHELAGPGHLAGLLVHDQVAHAQPRALVELPGHARAAQQATEPGDDLLQAEGLGDVVVAARRDARDTVLHRVPRGEEEHAHVGLHGMQGAQHRETVGVREHHVQDDGVRHQLPGLSERGRSVPGRADLPALVAQGTGEHLGEVGVVVDDEDAQGVPSGRVRAGRPDLVMFIALPGSPLAEVAGGPRRSEFPLSGLRGCPLRAP